VRSLVMLGAVMCGVAGLVIVLVVVLLAMASRSEQPCMCGHLRGQHQELYPMGFPCTVCQSCPVFTPPRRVL